MPRVTLRLPAVLAPVSGGEREIEVEGATIGEALAALARARPALGMHLFDESGTVRQYVACFHNETFVRPPTGLTRPLREGDRLMILNAIAGGAA